MNIRTAFYALAATLFVSCNPFKPFTFVQMSDTQIGFMDDTPHYQHTDSLVKAAVDAINLLNPALVINTGDILDQARSTVQDSIYRARMAELVPPLWVVPGNHDIMGYDSEKHDFYVSLRGYDRFSFKKNGCAFIGIDSNCIWDHAEEAEIDQKEWLEKELEAAKDSKYIFVFLHCPIIREDYWEKEDYFNFPQDRREEYLTLFKKAGVSAIFSGHCHMDYASEWEGIKLYVAGPVAAPIGRGKSGYNVVKVGKKGFEVTYTPTPGIKQ